MKVLRTIPSFYPSVTGPANQAYNISVRLKKKGITSRILTSNQGAKNSPKSEVINGVEIKRFEVVGRFLQYNFTPMAINSLFKDDFEILHAHSYRNFLCDAAFLTSKLRNKPFILHGHGTLLGYKQQVSPHNWKPYRLHDALSLKLVVNRADAIVVSSDQEFNEAIDFGINEDKITIIPPGIEFDEDLKKERSGDNLQLLFVGRIARDRNVEQILRAFKDVHELFPDAELYIVGGEERRSFTDKKGYVADLMELSKKLNLESRVFFTGPLYGGDLKNMYVNSDVFLNASFYENFGQTVLEAAAVGLPIISTPVGVANDIVVNDETGYLVKNLNDLSEKAIQLLENKRLRDKFGEKLREICKEKYNWDNIIEEYVQLYNSLA